MTRQLNCPSCKKPLYFPDAGECNEDFLESICTACKYKYALVYLQVLNFASSVEPLQSGKLGQPISYNRVYELRALTPNDVIKTFQFSTPGQDEKLQTLPGDELMLLYTMRGNKLENLILVVNCTTGKSCQLLSPSSKARSLGVNAALLTLLGGGVLAIFLHGTVLLVTAIPSAIGVGLYVTKRFIPKERDTRIAAQLLAEQKLLQRKFDLEQPMEALRGEKATNQRLIKRLEILQQKMLRVGDLYTERAQKVESAIVILKKQLGLTENLIAGYTTLVEMIDIEYETSRLAQQLPEDIDSRILSKLDELKAIEQQKEELGLRVDPSRLLGGFAIH